MKIEQQIVKDQILFELGEEHSLDNNLFNEKFWTDFTNAILLFESDSRKVYKMVLTLHIDARIIEKIISIIPEIFGILILELAQEYVEGHASETTIMLVNSKETLLKKEIDMFSNLNKATNMIERQRIKTELPTMFDKLQKKYLDNQI
ncbi:hypothetical protein HNP99_001619 [Flavobacterium sp. 28A]|uniref:hypothetical protein n=1 Tax=Flavobacterium sp. 28A TaxID=2735895 RepID=UPI00156E4089|nr:hypothetical protein [Flavobacterium sp. 28A]NRT15272.1 hypothetical protein [Flavobacterium sp. 28A]